MLHRADDAHHLALLPDPFSSDASTASTSSVPANIGGPSSSPVQLMRAGRRPRSRSGTFSSSATFSPQSTIITCLSTPSTSVPPSPSLSQNWDQIPRSGSVVGGGTNTDVRTLRGPSTPTRSLSISSPNAITANGAGSSMTRGETITAESRSSSSKQSVSPRTTKAQQKQQQHSRPTSTAPSHLSQQQEGVQIHALASLPQAQVHAAAVSATASLNHPHHSHQAHSSLHHYTAAATPSIPPSHSQLPLGAAGALPPSLWMSQFVPGLSGGSNSGSGSGGARSPPDINVSAAVMAPGRGGVSEFAIPNPFKDEEDVSSTWAGTPLSAMQRQHQAPQGQISHGRLGEGVHQRGAQQQLPWQLALQDPLQQHHPQAQVLAPNQQQQQHAKGSSHSILQHQQHQQQRRYPPPSSTASSYTNPSLLSGLTGFSGSSGHRSSATSVSIASAALASEGGIGASAVSPSVSVLSDIILADDFVFPIAGIKGKGKQSRAAKSRPTAVESDKYPPSSASPSENNPHLSSIYGRGGAGAPGTQAEGGGEGEEEIEAMARSDPLATQVWRMYARTKAQLPHAQRMENLTWRMMALALRKKKAEETRTHQPPLPKQQRLPSQMVIAPEQIPLSPVDGEPGNCDKAESANGVSISPGPGDESAAEDEHRGRTPAKGVAKMRIVGFGADGDDDDDAE